MSEQSKATHELLRSFDKLPIEVAALDSRGEIVYVNAAWREYALSNGAPGDFLGENYLDVCRRAGFMTPAAAAAQAAIDRAIAGISENTPLFYSCPDERQMRWFRMHVAPVDLPGDVRAVVMHQEVAPGEGDPARLATDSSTPGGDSPAQLFDSAQWLHVVLDAVNAGLWRWDIQSGDVFWSPESYRLFGLQPESTQTDYKVWQQMIHPDDRDAVDAAVRRTLDERIDLLDLEFRIVLPNGDVRWMKDRGKLVLDESGQPVQMIGIQIDITDQKHIAAALDHERILLRTVIDALPLALYVKDTEARKVLTNATDLVLLGESDVSNVLGKTDQELFPDENGQACYTEDLEVLRTGEPVLQRSVEFTNQEGVTRQVLLSKTPLRNRDQEIIGLVGITEDVTELKRLETRLWESRQLEALGALASNIGHDFNNLLTPIIGLSEVLYGEAAPGSRQRQYLDKILNAAYKAKDLLKQMRVFSRLHKAEVKNVNLLATVMEACDILRVSLPATITLTTTFHVVSARVEADPSQVHQMIMNLLVNAHQAIGDGPGEITVTIAPLATAGDKHGIKLTVIDTGQGMDAATMQHIFEPFFTTKRGSGSGLGLAIVHGVVQNLGGTIHVVSQPGEGSTFTIELPDVEVEC